MLMMTGSRNLIEHVDEVLEEIDAHQVPQILVFNKIDQTQLEAKYISANLNSSAKIWLSAVTGEGEELLLQAMYQIIFKIGKFSLNIKVPPALSKLRAMFYQNNWVQNEMVDEKGVSVF